MNKAQLASHDRALKLKALFEAGVSSKGICESMGWTTDYPGQMVTKEIRRLRDRGYEVGARGSVR